MTHFLKKKLTREKEGKNHPITWRITECKRFLMTIYISFAQSTRVRSSFPCLSNGKHREMIFSSAMTLLSQILPGNQQLSITSAEQPLTLSWGWALFLKSQEFPQASIINLNFTVQLKKKDMYLTSFESYITHTLPQLRSGCCLNDNFLCQLCLWQQAQCRNFHSTLEFQQDN